MAADQDTATRKPQVFRSVTSVIVWWVWLLFAIGNLIDLAVQGRDHLSLLAAAILLMVTGVAYVTAQRPRVVAATDTLTVRNPLRDYGIPWPNVIRADVSDLLRIRFRDNGRERAVNSWAVHYSRRRQYIADTRARRAEQRGSRGGGLGLGLGGGAYRSTPYRSTSGPGGSRAVDPASAEAQAQQAVRMINEYSSGIPADEPRGTVAVTWSWPAIAALVIPAIFVVIVAVI